MKLVRIDEDLYLNPEFVSSIEPNDDSSSIITMNNNDVFPANIPIKKVLDAISGSEEHSVEYEDAENYRRDNNYSIIVSNDNGEVKIIGNRPEVLSSLDLLKNDETLTIKRAK